ncbi:transposase [Salmonella enterica subsp. arizonae]|uniref:Transposase n=1 Tax=Salmonella enterica subsp. arizonae TaxID=59203 RepID=A0A379SQY0_SALER|nr:transposase [Salmonella enterica subsp. arizonae]
MVRNSLKYVARKDYKAVTSGLKAVYPAPTEEAALMALDVFADEWGRQISANQQKLECPPGKPQYIL